MDASTLALSRVHKDWLELFPEEFKTTANLLNNIKDFAPNLEDVFKVFEIPPSSIKVLILGQDPYPTTGDAMGLAFSVKRNEKLPKSLQNIFKELHSDLGLIRTSGELSDWQSQGVFLLNRYLTAPIGHPLGHQKLGWEVLTDKVITHLGKLNVVALLMGKPAEEFAPFFKKVVITPHPSPLSAYRGFFGSKPFSRINDMLEEPIKW
ncbi:MAG: uracil-DNA glycosylase [Actinomycetales bacterium]|nr:uracil-DNA glycosylase [Actinomycetales bacterium]